VKRRIKPVEQAIADTDAPDSRLRKNLTWWDLTVFGVSVVIGVGIFTVTASTAGNITGPAITVSFVIAAIVSGLAAMCYAELASTVPVAGSAYSFSYIIFGELIAWLVGWDLILEFVVAAAVVAKGWASYLSTVFDFQSQLILFSTVRLDWGALLIISVVTALLISGNKLSARVSLAISAIKVSVVVLVVIVGAFYIDIANYSPFIPPPQPGGTSTEQSLLSLITGSSGSHYGWYGVLAGASIVFFAFIGFDIVATSAEEARNPQRDVPFGILGALALVTTLYVAVVVVLTGMVRYTVLRQAGEQANLATAFAANGIHWAANVISVGALAGLTTVEIVVVLGQTRLWLAMSRDGLIPRWLARTGRRGTPVRITVLAGVVVAVAATVFPIGKLDEMVNIGTLFAFVLVSAGVIQLRRTRPDLPQGFRVPWMPLLPIASMAACAWLMLNLTALTWIRFGVWMAAGVLIYLMYGRTHSVQARHTNSPMRSTDADAARAAETD
jgi:APA family basic amino acid/polyamine antiporter